MGSGWPWTTAFSSRCSPKSNVHQRAFSPWSQMLFSWNHRRLSNCLWQSLDQQWADFLALKLWKQFAQTQPSFIFPNTIKNMPVAGSLIRHLGWSLGPEVSQVSILCIGSAKQLPITLDGGGRYLIYLTGTNCWTYQQKSQIHSYTPRSFSSSRVMVVAACFF